MPFRPLAPHTALGRWPLWAADCPHWASVWPATVSFLWAWYQEVNDALLAGVSWTPRLVTQLARPTELSTGLVTPRTTTQSTISAGASACRWAVWSLVPPGEGEALPPGDARFQSGWHAAEASSSAPRWTDGNAVLPPQTFAGFTAPFEVVVQVGATARYIDGIGATRRAA